MNLKKKLLPIITALLLAVIVLPAMSQTAYAADSVDNPTGLRWEGSVAKWNACRAYYGDFVDDASYYFTLYEVNGGTEKELLSKKDVGTALSYDISSYLASNPSYTGKALRFKVQAYFRSMTSNTVSTDQDAVFRTITFNTMGGSIVPASYAADGMALPRPEDPTMDGKLFAFWHKDEACTTVWDFDNDKIDGDMTLYAKWDEEGAHSHGGVNFKAWDRKDSLPSSPGSYYLTSDVSLGSTWVAPSGVTAICLNGHNVNGFTGPTGKESAIKVGKGNTLLLYDCEKSGKVLPNNTKAVEVEAGTFMLDGATIEGGHAENGGGVYVGGGTFEMRSGSITGCGANTMGGGVFVQMKTIDNVDYRGMFRMRGGTITGNGAMYGGAVYLRNGDIEISGGTVTENIATQSEQCGGIAMGPYDDKEATIKLIPALSGEQTDPINITGNTEGNLLLSRGLAPSEAARYLDITAKVHPDSRIGITVSGSRIQPSDGSPAVFTKSFDGNASLDNFTSDNEAYAVSTVTSSDTTEAALKVIHKVTFSPGQDSGEAVPEGSMDDVPVIDGESYVLPDVGYEVPAGHTFDGWKVGDKTYQPAEPIENVTSNLSATAQWKADVYTLEYDLDGGSLQEENPASYIISDKDITLKNPVRAGYEFTGWSGTDIDGTSTEVTIPKGSQGARSYKANWKICEYTITYRLNGGKTETENPVSYTIEDEDITLNVPVMEDYEFLGWEGTGIEDMEKTVTIPKGSTGDRKYTAVWKKLTPDDPESIEDAKIVLSKAAATYNGKVQKPAVKTVGGKALSEGTDYTAKWSNASPTNAGEYTLVLVGKGAYKGVTMTTYKINKAANPLAVSPKTAAVKSSKLKKKAQTLKVTKVIKFTKQLNDKKTYSLVSAKKGSKSFKKYFRINKTTGKVTIKKNKKMKKGTYKVKVKVRAAGNNNYQASAVKNVTLKIKIK